MKSWELAIHKTQREDCVVWGGITEKTSWIMKCSSKGVFHNVGCLGE